MQVVSRTLKGDDHKPLKVRDDLNESDSIDISFEYDGKIRSFARKRSENLQNTLARIGKNLLCPKKRKQKKKGDKNLTGSGNDQPQNDDTPTNIELYYEDGESIVSPETKNCIAWVCGRKLRVKDLVYRVFVNPPSLNALALPKSIMSGFPVFPFVQHEFSDKASTIYQWFVSKRNSDTQRNAADYLNNEQIDTMEWELVGEGFTFTPPISSVGAFLKITCIPTMNGKESPFQYEICGRNVVDPGPGFCTFEQRQLYTQKRIKDPFRFRIVSYNILADIYASGEFARKVLFPYCPGYAIDYHYRRQLFLKELRGYNADLICLQECDTKCFEGYLSLAMESDGFEGKFMKKSGETSEGEAIYYLLDKFSFIKDCSIAITEALSKTYCNDILLAMEKVPGLFMNFNKRKTVMQLVILKCLGSGRFVCVINTHLYYKPTGSHIRLLQVAVMMRHLENTVLELKSEFNVNCIDFVFCGDLNSHPHSAAIELITKQSVQPQNEVWSSVAEQEKGFNLELKHAFSFSSACGFPKYTNYVKGFKGTLDYIFLSPTLHSEGNVPIPTEEELEQHCALPSVVSPSDHLALICDVKWSL